MPVIIVGLITIFGSLSAQTPAPVQSERKPTSPQKMARKTENRAMQAMTDGAPHRAMLIVDNAKKHGLPLAYYHLLRAKIFRLQGRTAEQVRELQGAIHRNPQLLKPFLMLAELRSTQGLWLDAAELYQKAIDIQPSRISTYLQLAHLYRQHNRLQKALRVLQKGHKANPDNIQMLRKVAQTYEQHGQMNRARKAFEHIAHNTSGDTRRRALLKTANLNITTGNIPTGIAYFRTALAQNKTVSRQNYDTIAAACIRYALQLLHKSWKSLNAYLADEPGAPQRENVYIALQQIRAEHDHIISLMDTIQPPKTAQKRHQLYRLQLSIISESIVAACSYLDTGDQVLLAEARNRRTAALERAAQLGYTQQKRMDTIQ